MQLTYNVKFKEAKLKTCFSKRQLSPGNQDGSAEVLPASPALSSETLTDRWQVEPGLGWPWTGLLSKVVSREPLRSNL